MCPRNRARRRVRQAMGKQVQMLSRSARQVSRWGAPKANLPCGTGLVSSGSAVTGPRQAPEDHAFIPIQPFRLDHAQVLENKGHGPSHPDKNLRLASSIAPSALAPFLIATTELEFPLTHSKQRAGSFSNRDKTPLLGVATIPGVGAPCRLDRPQCSRYSGVWMSP